MMEEEKIWKQEYSLLLTLFTKKSKLLTLQNNKTGNQIMLVCYENIGPNIGNTKSNTGKSRTQHYWTDHKKFKTHLNP